MLLARRLRLPDATRGLLLDLDGVLVDTLGLEAGAVDGILGRHVPGAPGIPFELLRSAFALPVPDSWRAILAGLGIDASDELIAALTSDLERVRVEATPEVLPGVVEVVEAALGELPVAVVSNNPSAHVAAILTSVGLDGLGANVVGNDEGLPSKPAPDMYLEGARRLGLAASDCAAVEDSLLGARAARLAGCFVVGVATGADDFAALEASPDVDRAYARFAPPVVRLAPGDVTVKRVASPNEFVSHMVEHIAWRAGCEVDLAWPSDDWEGLGAALGEALAPLLDGPERAWAMGLIDDGSAEVTLERAPAPGEVSLAGDPAVLDWFLGLRVEQLASGRPLVELLRGLAASARLRATIVVGSVDDAHHTWEAVFRGVGLALRELSPALVRHASSGSVERAAAGADGYGLRVAATSPAGASVVRTTAESVCSAELRLEDGPLEVSLLTSPSVDARGLRELVALLAAGAGVSGRVSFEATKLSSSHVVAEDVGMTLGAAFRELASARMAEHGIEGAGWGVAGDLKVALSWEGRKFLKLLPVGWTEEELKRFRVGTTLRSGLFSEDLDDFLDGFVGGMHASVMVHWPRTGDLDGSWAAVFECLGRALAMALRPNRARRGLIAGVKATLA